MTWKNLNRIGLMTLMALPLCGYGQGPVVSGSASVAVAPAPVNASPLAGYMPPSVAEVVKLTKAGMGEDVVLAFVKNSHTTYNLKADDILALKSAGVSSVVISAMLTHDSDMQNQAQNAPAPGPYVYNQQFYPPGPGGQPQPSQPIAQSPLAAAQAPANVAPADMSAMQPPPPQADVVTVSPGPDYYWAPGYWGWNGGWIWIGGGWYPHGYYGWGYRGGWGGYRGGWGGYRGGGGFHGGGGHR